MQDAIKVFVDVPQINGYVALTDDPFVVQFTFNAQMRFFAVKNDAIISYQEGWSYNAEVGDTAGTIYAALYTAILGVCQIQALPTPAQKDIFCYIPISLSQIFTDIPSIA